MDCNNYSFVNMSGNSGVIAEYHITRREEAARFYNSLVPDADCIPLF